MNLWKIAGVQMDCSFKNTQANLGDLRSKLRQAADMGARLVLFPECILTGYGFDTKESAWPVAQTIPGPATEAMQGDCQKLGVWAAFGLLEKDEATGRIFNACALTGPAGQLFSYRKLHLPFLGIDRFATPGDRPLAVHDLGGLRVGMTICYDGSFPEASRVLGLQGADLILLPTNWATAGMCAAQYLSAARALENRVYYMAVNRIGDEEGFHYIGESRIHNVNGDLMAHAGHDRPAILIAEIDADKSRQKKIVNIPGKYEIDRIRDRRPEMYGLVTEPVRPA
jgi:predicted amidohydrolase